MRTTVKICFVMDCTASMGTWMQAAKDHIQTLIYDARESHPEAVFQVAFVGYRDYGSEEPYVVVGFREAEALVRDIRRIRPMDGDDEAEDVAGGLWQAQRLEWEGAEVRLVYHIADAPAHGHFFTQGQVSDRFPEGDPKFIDPRQSLKEWSTNGYHYTFVRIAPSTDTMVDHFHACWTGSGTFRVIDLKARGPSGFLSTLHDSLRETLTHHTSLQDPAEA